MTQWKYLRKSRKFAVQAVLAPEKQGEKHAAKHGSFYTSNMKIKEVVTALERFAPLPLQESYDNAGLQVGLTEAEVSGALLCLDVTEAIVDEAVDKGCNLIVAHHPLIFRKLAHVIGENFVQRALVKAIKQDVAIMALHTNLDNARGGVNFKMAEKLGLEHADFVSKEWCGDVEKGCCVMGEFPRPMAPADFMAHLKKVFRAPIVLGNELLQRPIAKVALCGGAGSFALVQAVAAGADAFVTGEMHYHEYFDHEQELQIAVLGHYESEQFTVEIFKEIIEKECPGVPCHVAETFTNPINVY